MHVTARNMHDATTPTAARAAPNTTPIHPDRGIEPIRPPRGLVLVLLMLVLPAATSAVVSLVGGCTEGIDVATSAHLSTTSLGLMRLAFSGIVFSVVVAITMVVRPNPQRSNPTPGLVLTRSSPVSAQLPGMTYVLTYLPGSTIRARGGPATLVLEGRLRFVAFTVQTWTLLGVYFALASVASLADAAPSWLQPLVVALFSVVYPMSLLVSFVTTWVLIPAALEKGPAPVLPLQRWPALVMHNANIAFASAELCLSRNRVLLPLVGLSVLYGCYYIVFAWRVLAVLRAAPYFFLDPTLPLRRSVPLHLALAGLTLAFGALGALLSHLSAQTDAPYRSVGLAATVVLLSTRVRIPTPPEPGTELLT